MATYGTLSCSFLLMAIFISISVTSSSTDNNIPSRDKDMIVATKEMQRANYFTFVMLINMAPSDLFLGNVTFLMPNDKTLSKTMIPENTLVDFLLRHSIPAPLLFQHLLHFPTSSMIPTSKPELMLRVSNNGGRQFFLNNVRFISPNICIAGSSIRCHGIDGVVLAETSPDPNLAVPSPTCSSVNGTIPQISPAAPTASPLLAPTVGGFNLTPSGASTLSDPDVGPQNSGSSHLLSRGRPLIEFAMTCTMLLVVKFSI